MLWTCRLNHLSICLCVCVRKVYCGKTAERIWMPFGVVRGLGRGMGVLDGVVIIEGEGAVLGMNLGRPIVTNGDLWLIVVRKCMQRLSCRLGW